jgi:hypothetical protein
MINKWFKYSLITLMALVLLFFSLAIYVYQNLDQFKAYALKEINKQLKSEISTGRIDLNLYADFPRVSITFNQVSITDPIQKDSLLFKAKNLYLGFNFYDVLQKKYLLQSLIADSAIINVYINDKGLANYDIFKSENSSSSKPSSFKFELNLLKLKNSYLSFRQDNLNQFYSVFFKETSLSGNFSDKEFELKTYADAFVQSINLSGLELIHQKPLVLDLNFLAKPSDGLYTIKEAKVKLSMLNLLLSGNIQQAKTFTDFNLNFKGDKIKIQDLISLFPFQLPESMNDLKSEGSVYFTGNYLGKESHYSKPKLNLDFGVENGSLINSVNGIKLSNIYFKGNFISGKEEQQLGNLKIEGLKAQLGEESLEGAIDIELSKNAKLNAKLKGGFDLCEFQKLVQLSSIKSINGMAKFNLFLNAEQVNGVWNWMNSKNTVEMEMQGNEIVLNDFTKPIQNYNIGFVLKDENIQISNLELKIGKTDLKGSGYLPGLLSENKSKVLEIDLKSESNYLDAQDLMIYEPSNSNTESTQSSNKEILIHLRANAESFKYQDLIGKSFKADLEIKNGSINIIDLKLNAWGGLVQTSGTFDFSGKNFILEAEPKLQNVKVKQLLKEFNDFAQDAIKSEHIDGTLSCNSKVLMVWDDKFNFLKPKFKAVAELNMKNGQLINYQPLFALSKFIDINDLKNLKFSEMSNTLEIVNEKMIIPEMDIKTNAISLSISGNHTFENYLDYHLKITLSELLNKKRKVTENEFGEEADAPGKVNLFLSIKGPANNLKFVYDKKAVRAKIAADLKKEGATIKEIIKSEIGFTKDTTIKQSNKKDGNNDELEFEPD